MKTFFGKYKLQIQTIKDGETTTLCGTILSVNTEASSKWVYYIHKEYFLGNMFKPLLKPWAFVKKDFLVSKSYKAAYVMEIIQLFMSMLIFSFVAKLFGEIANPYLKAYGGNYFSFVIIGIALADYLNLAMGSFTKSIYNAQVMGTLEALLVTQTEAATIILSSTFYSYIWVSIRVIVYLTMGVFLFSVPLDNANYLLALLFLVLTIISFSTVGIISASFIMVFKRGDPITWLFSSLSWFLGGLYYPVSVLPSWLQKVAYFLPITHALEGMRLALLNGATFSAVMPNILALSVFSILMLPLSLISFRYAIYKAKLNGSLTHY